MMNKKETNNATDFVASPPNIEEIEKRIKKQKIVMQSVLVAVFLIAGLWFATHQNPEVDYIGGNVLHVPNGEGSQGRNWVIPPWRNANFVNSLIFSTLFVTDSSYTEVNSGIAEKYTVSDDGLTYVITIGSDYYWSDGEPVTVDDVMFSIEGFMCCEMVNSYLSSAFNNIEGATDFGEGKSNSISGLSSNGNEITIQLEEPQSTFPLMLTQFVPMPKHILGDEDMSTLTSDLEFYFDLNPVTNGLFMLDSFNEDGNLILSQNPHNPHLTSDIESVVLYFDADKADVDYYGTTDPTKMVSYRSMKGYEEYMVDVYFYRYFLFNLHGGDTGVENTVIQDVRVRQAIYHALDVETLFNDVYFSKGNLVHGGSLTLADEVYEYNPEKSKQLLEEAGYDFSRPFHVMYYSGDTSSRIFLEKVQSYLEAVGLTVKLTKAEVSAELYDEASYDMMMKNLSAFNTQDWYSEYLSTSANMSKVFSKDGEFDDLFEELNATTDIDSFNKVLQELVDLEQELLYKMPMFLIGEAIYINETRLSLPDDMVFGNTRYFSDLRLDEWSIKQG